MAYLYLAIMSFIFCFLTGNTVASLPVMFLVYEVFFREKDKDDASRFRFRILISVLLLLTALAVMIIFFIGRNKFIHTIFYFKGASYLIVTAKALGYYLKIIYLPLARGLYHPFAYNSVDTNKISPAFFGSLAIICFSIILFFRCLKKDKAVAFGLAFFFITYLPYSNLIPVCNIISERYVYLPTVGIAIFMSALFLKAWQIINKDSKYKKILRITAMVIIILFLSSYAALTVKRNREYRDIITYWKTNITNFPDGYMAYNNLAGTFYVLGQPEQALAYSWIALLIKADQPHVWCNLGKVYIEKGDMKMSKYCYEEAYKYDKNFLPAIQGMSIIKKRQNK
jgi:tetratricopeptide (TPR) repeat protein